MKQRKISAGMVLAYLLLMACTKKQAEEFKPEAPETPGAKVSYAAVIDPIFKARCNGCHSAGRSGSVAWTFSGLSSVTADADRIKNAVLVKKSMPLGGSLSATDLQSIKDWFDQGMQP
ncbi:MAG: cytochrome c [Pedobacter sp.]|uniref:cytochrome c n=1 Tax=Pedobacter sp. TaxID=1411316 RepID=UPI003395A35A